MFRKVSANQATTALAVASSPKSPSAAKGQQQQEISKLRKVGGDFFARILGTNRSKMHKPLQAPELLDEFQSSKQKAFAAVEYDKGAHNYHPMPVVLVRGKGHQVWDADGTAYYDFLSAYSACNQGHCHPKLVAALQKQAETLALTSRAFYNDCLGEFETKITKIFGYDRVIPMNSGAEGVETAVKIVKRWGYRVKGIAANQGRLIFMNGNFHGRTTMCISASDDPVSRQDFGPFVPNIDHVPFGDIVALEKLLAKQGTITAAVIFEPIQGEAGIYVPPAGYLQKVRELCTKYNVLMVADEVQTGLCRTGTMLRCDAEKVRPDVVILGKALSGGLYPISAVLADSPIMLVLDPGSHGSTFGGNPIAAKVGCAALDVLIDEKLADQSQQKGELFRKGLNDSLPSWVTVRGAGLLNAVIVSPRHSKHLGRQGTAFDVCMHLMTEHHILCKPTHEDIIRLAPPLVIPQEDLDVVVAAIAKTIETLFGK
jgi:ornithine--oxo-acid transaminase